MAGGGDAEQVNQLAEAGRDLGLAFQIVDDCLDVTGTLTLTGGATALAVLLFVPETAGRELEEIAPG